MAHPTDVLARFGSGFKVPSCRFGIAQASGDPAEIFRGKELLG